MTPKSQAPQALPALPPVTTPGDARKLADGMLDTMNALLAVIERETELVRAGKIREGMALEKQKSELSRRYAGAIGHFKSSQAYITRSTPELLAALQRHHDMFRAMLQVNLDGARHRARGLRRHRARRQRRGPAPHRAANLHRQRTAQRASAPAHQPDRGEPVAVASDEANSRHSGPHHAKNALRSRRCCEPGIHTGSFSDRH